MANVSGTFKAWLSTSTVNAIDHIEGAGPWYMMYETSSEPKSSR